MKTINVLTGTPEWHAHRALHLNASDAPAMLGCSPYMTRAQLLHKLHTGLSAEADSATQRRFDDGHRFEALARPLAEKIIGDDLAPVVGTTGKLSASFDGLTLMGDTAFEHKTANDELRACMRTAGEPLPKHYRVQMEQQLLVSGAERVLFMASKWDGDTLVEEKHCWYEPDAALRAEIVNGWKQFEEDLAAYVPPAAAPVTVAAPVESLPAVLVNMRGSLTVESNLDAFGKALRAFIDKIPAKPSTDQEFADTDAACKALKKTEEALAAEEGRALASMADVQTMRSLVAELANLARTTRLAREKMVEARKLEIRTEEVARGKAALAAHVAGLNATIGKPYMPANASAVDFGAAIKGLRSLDSVRAAIDQRLADAKIAANEVHSTILQNMGALRELAADHAFLFADTASLVLKAPDDCRAQITSRIAAHRAEQEKKEAETRERIRQEEVARLAREQEARDRETARQAAEAAKPAPAPAAQPIAAPAAPPQAAAANSPTVVPIAGRAAAAEPATLKLGDINARLGFTMTAEFVANLGIVGVRDRSAVLFRESQFQAICDALLRHVTQIAQAELQAA